MPSCMTGRGVNNCSNLSEDATTACPCSTSSRDVHTESQVGVSWDGLAVERQSAGSQRRDASRSRGLTKILERLGPQPGPEASEAWASLPNDPKRPTCVTSVGQTPTRRPGLSPQIQAIPGSTGSLGG